MTHIVGPKVPPLKWKGAGSPLLP